MCKTTCPFPWQNSVVTRFTSHFVTSSRGVSVRRNRAAAFSVYTPGALGSYIDCIHAFKLDDEYLKLRAVFVFPIKKKNGDVANSDVLQLSHASNCLQVYNSKLINKFLLINPHNVTVVAAKRFHLNVYGLSAERRVPLSSYCIFHFS